MLIAVDEKIQPDLHNNIYERKKAQPSNAKPFRL